MSGRCPFRSGEGARLWFEAERLRKDAEGAAFPDALIEIAEKLTRFARVAEQRENELRKRRRLAARARSLFLVPPR